MDLTFKVAQPGDVADLFDVRARTRENAMTPAALAARGITPASTVQRMQNGDTRTWVCADGTALGGFCSGDTGSGEVLVLAVLPQYERCGIGTRLLANVVAALREAGCPRLWLAAPPDPQVRSLGRYAPKKEPRTVAGLLQPHRFVH